MRKSLIFLVAVTLGFLFLFHVTGSRGEAPGSCEARAVLDDRYFKVALDRINRARKTIDLMMFELVYYPGKHGPTNRLIEALASARNRGVRVRVIMEGGESYLGSRFTRKVTRTQRILSDLGIDVHYDRDGQTMHSKLLIIDSLWVLVGSTNWSYYSLTRNREANVLIRSKDLALSFTRYFENTWR